MLRVYAKELEFEFRKAKTIGTRFQDFLGNALRNSDLQKKKTCKVCNEKISTIKRWISTPKILAISIVWDPSDYDFARILMMTFRMELQSRSIFFAEDEQEITEVYIFRGIVCFQYNHYCTFIFVPEENSWYQVDDSFIKKIQNFTQIIQMMEKNNSIPVLLLYENDYGQMKRKNQRIGKIKENENDRNCLSCEIF